MQQRSFAKPVLVDLPLGDGAVRHLAVSNARDGLAAMTQHGLGQYRMGQDDWRTAFSALVRAVLEPTPENLEKGRSALEALAHAHATKH